MMRRIRLTPTLIVAVLALTAISAGAARLPGQGSQNEFLVTEGKAGPIEVGMPIDDIVRRVGRERIRLIDQAKEGHFSPAIEIDIPGASISAPIIADFSANPCGGGFAVSGITVFDPKFRTSDGLGVGSTLGQLRRVRSVRVSHEEGVSAIVQGVRMAFALDPPLDMNNARLASIWLWLEAGTVRA